MMDLPEAIRNSIRTRVPTPYWKRQMPGGRITMGGSAVILIFVSFPSRVVTFRVRVWHQVMNEKVSILLARRIVGCCLDRVRITTNKSLRNSNRMSDSAIAGL